VVQARWYASTRKCWMFTLHSLRGTPRFSPGYRRRSRSRPTATTFRFLLEQVPFWQRSTSANRRGSIQPLRERSVLSAAIRLRFVSLRSLRLFLCENTQMRWSRLGRFEVMLTGGVCTGLFLDLPFWGRLFIRYLFAQLSLRSPALSVCC
jgi:hypothetical protein